MLPVVSRLAIEMIDGSWRQRRGDAFEPIALLATKAHGGRLAQRDADDMAENRPVTMPADPRAWIVANEESLDDLFRCEPGIAGGARPDWQQPLRDWVGRRECAGFEIIAPAIAACQPLAGPLLVAEGRKARFFDPFDQRSLFARREKIIAPRKARQERRAEKVSLPCAILREHTHVPNLLQKARLV